MNIKFEAEDIPPLRTIFSDVGSPDSRGEIRCVVF